MQRAATRYPYLCVRVRRSGDDRTIAFNDAPVPVIRGRRPVVLGSAAANGHYIAVAYEGDRLFVDASHNLCDANGLLPFAKTVMYLYLKQAADPRLDATGIRLPGTPFLENEVEDPYEGLTLPEHIRPFYRPPFSPAFVPDRRYARGAARYNCIVKASSADFVRFFRSHDGSPIALASYFLKEMIERLFPERGGLPIRFAMPHALRQDLRDENNYHDQVMPLFVQYDARTDALPVVTQLTVSRGSMLVQMTRASVQNHVRELLAFSEALDALQTTDEKRALCRSRLEPIIQNPETMCVSYPGHIEWNALSGYMREVHMRCTVLAAPIFVAISTLGDTFWFCFMQRDETDLYAQTFVDILRENGIAAELVEAFREEALEGIIPLTKTAA